MLKNPETINAELVLAMKRKLPEGVNLANYLMDILSLGKEAVYRRLRGEVPFTLSESFLVAQKLGLSLDQLTGATLRQDTHYDLNLFSYDNPEDTYYATTEYYLNLFQNLLGEGAVTLCDTANRIPTGIFMQYRNISRFNFLKRKCFNSGPGDFPTFETIDFPERLYRKQEELVEVLQNFPRSVSLWDEMIFESFVKEVKYFRKIDAITPESVGMIKEELLDIVERWSDFSARGENAAGNRVELFISNLNFQNCYSYIESEKSRVSLMKVYDLNTILSKDEKIFESVKNWIQALKKFSTLISQSGQMQHHLYFRRQRELIQTL